MKRDTDIHCPGCGYLPQPDDRWSCVPSCGTSWHTFWTRGVCPGCGVRWPKTQCPACTVFSAHEAWYHDRPDSEPEGAREQERERERDGVVNSAAP